MSEVDEIALLFDPPWKDFNESSNHVTFARFEQVCSHSELSNKSKTPIRIVLKWHI